ncbi:MAG TPA: hypothetical protein VMT35_04570, partial [Ignavibacteriaceae bacterium]|nr:hypothetical protein [Ignavibacteriaceae bacterium]
MKTSAVFNLLLLLSLQSDLKPQSTQAFDFISWPKSVSSYGMGEMGVASLTNDDALIYNPAKLSLTKNTGVSFFRNPLTQYWSSKPFTSVTAYHKDENAGSFALSYDNRDHDAIEYSLFDEYLGGISWEDHNHSSEGSVAVSYARNINDN